MKSNRKMLQSNVVGTVSAAVLVLVAGGVQAAVSEAEAAKLGKELTPVGAERAGNKDGSIPEFKGGTPKGKLKLGDPRGDPYAGEKPLFSIDASNVDKYKDKLTAGQIELIKTRKGYRMDVYPTHRSCGYPDIINERTKKNATLAKLTTDGKDNLATALGKHVAHAGLDRRLDLPDAVQFVADQVAIRV